MKDLILFLAKSLVENPDAVQVTETEGPDSIILELNVAPEDMGKVIGRMGNTAKAVRTLLRVVGMKNNARVNLKINEPEGGKRAGQVASESSDVDDVIADLKAE